MNEYYDGTKLLSLKDIRREKPGIYIVTTNRTGGKTTYFNRLMVNRFLKRKKKFCIEYRFENELDGCVEAFWKDIHPLFFPHHTMKGKVMAKGKYLDIYLDDRHCGYAVAINNAEFIKKKSQLFQDVDSILNDEFQSETNKYAPNEIRKFRSIQNSIARGRGEQVRYVPVYLVGNPVTILNPYYSALGITERLDDKTRFLRGDGWVMEQGYVRSAADAISSSPFNRAFAASDDTYNAYASEGVYLNDSKTMLEKPSGKSRYIATIRYAGRDFGVRAYDSLGIVHASGSADLSYPVRIAVTTDDFKPNYVSIRSHSLDIDFLRYYFNNGCFRFSDLSAKQAITAALAYR